jgi:hypothetical protein
MVTLLHYNDSDQFAALWGRVRRSEVFPSKRPYCLYLCGKRLVIGMYGICDDTLLGSFEASEAEQQQQNPKKEGSL